MISVSENIDFLSLGGVWLDTIEWKDKLAQVDVVGGSATFATLGARFFACAKPARLAMIVQAGHDFPESVLSMLRSWRIELHVVKHVDQPSTRGILTHTSAGQAHFRRLTPPLLTTPEDVARLGLLDCRVFHLFGTSDMAHQQCKQLHSLQQTAHPPLMIWEPHPKSCTPGLLADHVAVLCSGSIAVFSPNHFELATFYEESPTVAFNHQQVESQAMHLWMKLGTTTAADTGLQALIVRAAEHGCLLLTTQHKHKIWLPAYWSSQQQDHVVDPTGAGNAFLGALSQGWLETGSWTKAACYASVAAGLVVEQVGVPVLGATAAGETWSGVSVRERLSEYMGRDEVRSQLANS